MRLKQERSGANLSQSALAEKIGVSRATIKNWETGQSEATASQINSLCDIFECSSDWLLGRSDKRIKSDTNLPPKIA